MIWLGISDPKFQYILYENVPRDSDKASSRGNWAFRKGKSIRCKKGKSTSHGYLCYFQYYDTLALCKEWKVKIFFFFLTVIRLISLPC